MCAARSLAALIFPEVLRELVGPVLLVCSAQGLFRFVWPNEWERGKCSALTHEDPSRLLLVVDVDALADQVHHLVEAERERERERERVRVRESQSESERVRERERERETWSKQRLSSACTSSKTNRFPSESSARMAASL